LKQAVADASFCGAWILPDEWSADADRLLARIVKGAVQLVVPSLWHYEMGNLLRSAVRRKRLTVEDMWLGLETVNRVPLSMEDLPGTPARRRILHLALQFNLSFYDASYLELADRLKVPLYSADGRVMATAKQLGL
jgi:predicted nucleic acid-binding protein